MPTFAAESRLLDFAGRLNDWESGALCEKLNEESAATGADIVVVTTNSFGEQTAREYVKEVYKNNGFSYNTVIIAINFEEMRWIVCPYGYLTCIFTESVVDEMSEQFIAPMTDNNFYEGFSVFATLCGERIWEFKEKYNLSDTMPHLLDSADLLSEEERKTFALAKV